MASFSELRARLERLPVLKGPLAPLLHRLEKMDVGTLTDAELVEHGAHAHVGERDMQTILVAFRTFKGAAWAPGLTGLYTIADVAHRLSCPTRDCARCGEMAQRTAIDPVLRDRFASVARRVVVGLR